MKENFARFEQLLWIYLKRDWKKIILWIVLLGLFGGAFVPAFEEIAKGDGLIGMYQTMDNPALTAMVGTTPIDAAENYTLGAMYANEMLLFTGLISAIVSALHVVGHTRKEEDLGITELISSFRIGRQANSLAVIIETILINGLLTIFIGSIMLIFDANTIVFEGAFLFGVSIGMAGIMGATIALIMAQIIPTSGGATGSSLGILGFLYLTRGMTDVVNQNLSVINPMSWTYLTYPFTENNWSFLVYLLIFSIVGFVLAFVLEGNRDIGSGYIQQSVGRLHARKTLLSVPGVFLRLNRGMIVTWLIAFVIMGLAYGSIYGDLQSFVESNEMISQMFQQENMSIEASFTGTITLVMIGLVAILPIVVVNKLFTEEKEQRLNQVFATKVSRFKIFWVNIGIALLSGLVGIFLASGSLGVAGLDVMDESTALEFSDFIIAGFNQLPLVLFFIGLAALVLGFIPKLGKFIYIYLAYSFFIVYFEGLVDFPEWFVKTSIQGWFPQMPIEEFNSTVFLVITIISIFMIILGYIGYNRRDLIENA